MNITKTLDAKGLACPMPVVRTKKVMDQLNTGDILEVFVTDKGSLNDIPAWAKSCGHEILKQTQESEAITFYIQKG
ncbi:MAG TPA: sulfurtransferase TusA family protein [Rummeliibacillus sp.]|nr:sulfurtransferase TusA family protein [Rummeliibacillus sp.]